MIRVVVLVAVLTATTAGCAGGGGPGDGDTQPPAEGAAAAAQREEPSVEIADEAPPDQLSVQDLIVGEGEQVPSGAVVQVHYVGVLWEDGTRFDASWDRGEPATFDLDQVVPGFSQGIAGNDDIDPMRVGGRRWIAIPPALGYGETGAPPVIPPDATLVFVVDLLELPSAE